MASHRYFSSSPVSRITVLLAALAIPALLPAQPDTIRTGAARWVVPLRPGVDSSVAFAVRDGSRRPLVTYIETISEIPEGFLIVQQNVRPNGALVTLDSIALAAGTLAPIWHSDKTPTSALRVEFRAGRATGTSVDTTGAASPVDAAVPAGALDFSVASRLSNQLPLRTGYSVVLETFDVRRGVVYTPIQVLGEETIEIGGRTVKTWKVETMASGRVVHRWIDQATRRDVRARLSMGDWEMVMESP